jgi:hypothetical protein
MPDETTDPNITLGAVFRQGADTQEMVKQNTEKIECVDRKLGTHLTEHGVIEKMKDKFWGKTKNIIGLILAAITIAASLYGLLSWLKPDMKALALEIKKELPAVEYGANEEDPE